MVLESKKESDEEIYVLLGLGTFHLKSLVQILTRSPERCLVDLGFSAVRVKSPEQRLSLWAGVWVGMAWEETLSYLLRHWKGGSSRDL